MHTTGYVDRTLFSEPFCVIFIDKNEKVKDAMPRTRMSVVFTSVYEATKP